MNGKSRIGRGFFWGGPPYGDDAKDQAVISKGMDYAYERYNRNCLHEPAYAAVFGHMDIVLGFDVNPVRVF